MFYKIVLEDGQLSLKSLVESVLLAIPSCGQVVDFLTKCTKCSVEREERYSGEAKQIWI